MSIGQLSAPATPTPENQTLLHLDLASRGAVTLIAISGELDMSNAHRLTELVQHVARGRPLRVVLDMSEVSFFCAAGVSALLRARNTIMAAGGQLVLRDPSPRTWKVLTITCTDHVFPLDTRMTAAPTRPQRSQTASA
jgi:anti-anti-sigma factor